MPTTPLAWKNGRFVPQDELALSFADAGFVAAATVTDFCRTYRHKLFGWPAHAARLRRDSHALGIAVPYSDADLTTAADALAADRAARTDPADDFALITFATPGPLGYMTGSEDGPPTLGMHTIPLRRERYRRFFAEGVTLALAGVLPADPAGIVPAGVKHRSRLHWWLAEQAVRDPARPHHHPGAVAMLTDQAGRAADTGLGTVLVVVDGAVVRPPRGAVLDGVSVGVVEEISRWLGLRFEEADLDYRALPAGITEVLLAGSAFGVAGVRTVVGPAGPRRFEWPGPVYLGLLAEWNALVGLDIEKQFLG